MSRFSGTLPTYQKSRTSKRSRLCLLQWAAPSAMLHSVVFMSTSERRDPDLDGYVDWIVFTRDWNTFSEPCETEEEAQWVYLHTGGGPIYRREWKKGL